MKLWPFSKKSLAAPDEDLAALFGSVPVASGVTVSADSALRVPAVSAAVRVISEAAACLDVSAEGEAADVLALLTGEANDWTSGYELIRDLVAEALVTDVGALAHVNRVNGRPVEILRYARGVMTVEYDQVTQEPSYKLNNRPVPARDVIHLRSPFGPCPITLAREAIGVALVMERHAARLFGRGARPSGALTFPQGMGETAVKNTRTAWRATHEGDDAGGRTAILYDGAAFVPFAFTSVDAQFLEMRKFQMLEIARAFRVPPSMIFELDRATWSNTEQMGREFLVYCLEPWLRALEGALRRALGVAIRFDRDDLTRADLQTRATTINSLIASRVINPNEGRAWLGLPPREGGNTFENPNITTPAKEPPPNA